MTAKLPYVCCTCAPYVRKRGLNAPQDGPCPARQRTKINERREE